MSDPTISEENAPEETTPEGVSPGETSVEAPASEPETPKAEGSEEPFALSEAPALKHVVEALVFASQKPISAKEISAALRGAAEAAKENPEIARFAKAKENQIIEAIDALSADYASAGHAFEIRETVAGWQLVTAPPFAPWLRQLFPESKPARLSAPALETLAIIAYRQPATRADLEAVRGVAVDGVMQTLLDRQLIRIAGRADVPGRPLLYETTSHFMEHFGLRNLEELPNANELRRAAAELAASSQPAAETPAAPAPEAAPTEASAPAPEPENPAPLEETPPPPPEAEPAPEPSVEDAPYPDSDPEENRPQP